MINKYLEKNSKCNKKLNLLNTIFSTADKSFYWWCLKDEKVSVVSAVSVLALNAGISSSSIVSAENVVLIHHYFKLSHEYCCANSDCTFSNAFPQSAVIYF